MKRTNPFVIHWLALLTFVAVLFVTPVRVQSQSVPPLERDDNATRRQLASFDGFLDSHPEVAEQLRKDPSLVNNQGFVEKHPELQQYLQQHPEIREEISQNPNRFMHEEERFDRREDDHGVTREELANMDRFMDSHPEIAERKSRNNPAQ